MGAAHTDAWILEEQDGAWFRRFTRGEMIDVSEEGRPDPTGRFQEHDGTVYKPWDWTFSEMASRHLMDSRNGR